MKHINQDVQESLHVIKNKDSYVSIFFVTAMKERIINTFLESYDFSGKTIVPFATSGGSGMGNTNEKLAPSCPGAILMKGKMLNGLLSQEELKAWVKSL